MSDWMIFDANANAICFCENQRAMLRQFRMLKLVNTEEDLKGVHAIEFDQHGFPVGLALTADDIQ